MRHYNFVNDRMKCHILLVLIFIVSFLFASKFNCIYEDISIVATRDKNDQSNASEIYLSGFFTTNNNALDAKVIDGKWMIWNGYYCWRSEESECRPQYLTDSITYRIPVGSNRKVEFGAGVNAGIAKVIVGEKVDYIDTYSTVNENIRFDLEDSSSRLLILGIASKLLVFVVVFILLYGIVWGLWRVIRIDKTNGTHKSRWIVYAIIAIVATGLMIAEASVQSFWYDELGQIAFSNGGVKEAIAHCLAFDEVSPPLFTVVASLWYRIAPFGENWLLLLNIIPVGLSVFLIAYLGDRLFGYEYAILAESLLGFCPSVWNTQAFEFRSYAFPLLFMLLSLVFLMAVGEKKKNNILLSIFMCCLVMSHYFAMIGFVWLFCLAILMCKKRERNKKMLWAFVPPALCIILWFASVLAYWKIYGKGSPQLGWQEIPDWLSVCELFSYFSGYQLWLLFVIIVSLFIPMTIKRNERTVKNVYIIFAVLNVIATITIVYIYSRYIKFWGSMWVLRYFSFLFPYIALLEAYVINLMIQKVRVFSDVSKKTIVYAISVFVAISCGNYVCNNASIEPFREGAGYLYSQNDIFEESTVVLQPGSPFTAEGMREYYLEMQGERVCINYFSFEELTVEEMKQYQTIYVIYNNGDTPYKIEQQVFEEYEQIYNNTTLHIKKYERKNGLSDDV